MRTSNFSNDFLAVCLAENRCLITLDLEFANPVSDSQDNGHVRQDGSRRRDERTFLSAGGSWAYRFACGVAAY